MYDVKYPKHVKSSFFSYPATTECRNLDALSTTSSHTDDTDPSSNRVASGRDWRASRDSCSSSLQRSASSPERQARRRNANAKLRAARDPTRARPMVAFSAGFTELVKRGGKCQTKFLVTKQNFSSLHVTKFHLKNA